MNKAICSARKTPFGHSSTFACQNQIPRRRASQNREREGGGEKENFSTPPTSLRSHNFPRVNSFARWALKGALTLCARQRSPISLTFSLRKCVEKNGKEREEEKKLYEK